MPRINLAAVSARGYNMFNDRIMTCSDVIAAECPGLAPKIPELQFFIAHHTRVRRPASLVFTGEIINHDALKLIGLVHHIMRNAESMRYAARIGNGLRSAAFVLRSRDTILGPDLHCYTYDVVTLLTQQISADAGVHSTAHAEQNTLFRFLHRNEEFRRMAEPV